LITFYFRGNILPSGKAKLHFVTKNSYHFRFVSDNFQIGVLFFNCGAVKQRQSHARQSTNGASGATASYSEASPRAGGTRNTDELSCRATVRLQPSIGFHQAKREN
jgi:hypothetical protein